MLAYTSFLILIVSCLCYNPYLRRTNSIQNPNQYQCFSSLPDKSDNFRSKFLESLLIKRVPGTRGNAQVRQRIISILKSTKNWNIELDSFNASTPDGEIQFVNIIATLDPTATHRLVLACHYDSAKLPNFIAATDSAVPCAILLDLAVSLKHQLAQYKKNKKNPTLQLIFLDGEEAIQKWSNTDSLYGSRHLANKMRHTNVQGQQNLNQIQAIDLFVLLDLIGHKSLQIMDFYHDTTGGYFEQLQGIETELLQAYNGIGQKQPVFSSGATGMKIEDDQVPFLKYNVPILHLIAYPFPPVWHNSEDDEDNLDFTVIKHFRNIMKIFVTQYLHLKENFCE